MTGNFSVFVICVEAIMYLLLYNLHDYTFKGLTCKENDIFKIKIIHVTYSIIIIIALFTIDNRHIYINVQSALKGKKGNSFSSYKLQNF